MPDLRPSLFLRNASNAHIKDRAARRSPRPPARCEKKEMLLRCAFLFPSQYTTFKIQIRAIYRPICRFFVYFFSYNRRWRPAVPSLNGDPAAHDSNLALLPSLLCSQHIIKYIFSPMSQWHERTDSTSFARRFVRLNPPQFCPLGRRWQHHNCLISLAIIATVFSLVSILIVLSTSYIGILVTLLSITFSTRTPLSTSLANLLRKFASSAISEIHFTSQFCVSSFSMTESMIDC